MSLICPILKAPRVGTVKTRLARDVGAERAARIYRELVARQIKAIPRDWTASVHFAPADGEKEMSDWLMPILPSKHRFVPQMEGDLGQRLIATVRHEFQLGAECVFLVGGDCPDITEEYLYRAHDMLKKNPVVIGPADDGGYVLIGMTGPFAGLFMDITWSTSVVLEQTLAQVKRLKLTVGLLESLSDIDEVSDLQRMRIKLDV